MAEFIHSTEARIEGPFLIDRPQLEALNKILEEEWLRFRAERKLILDKAVAEEFKKDRARSYYKEETDEQMRKRIRNVMEQSYEFRERKECFVFFRTGSTAKVPDFVSALREPDLQDKEPNGLYAVLESGERSCEVKLTSRLPSLTVQVSPKRDPFVQETLMVLKNWQNSVRPPKWQSMWVNIANVGGIPWLVWLAAVMVSFMFIEMHAENAQVHPYSQEASQLLNSTNLSIENQGKAIQLLLAKTYGYAPQPIKREFPNWFFLLVFGGLAYCIAFSYTPDVSLAIGRGEKKVQFWRNYSKFILVTTPAFIFTTFMWPKIESILRSIF